MLYLDTSAFLKLFVLEEHSVPLRSALRGRAAWSSVLLDVETHRAAIRLGLAPEAVETALRTVSLVMPDAATFALARALPPPALRTLDALHLATALELGEDLDAVVTYDARVAAGSAEAGLPVDSPGLPRFWWVAPTAS